MNSIARAALVALSSTFLFFIPQEKGTKMSDRGPKVYATPEEAAREARNDLLRVVETTKGLNLGVDAARLREAKLAKLIRYVEIDFQKLLNAGTIVSLSELGGNEKSMVAPYVAGTEVVAIAEVGRTMEGWRVIALANKKITDDLNQTKSAVIENAVVTLYEVPNLQVSVYGVKENFTERYFLEFEQFNLKESASLAAFFPLLQENAKQFNQRWGDQLKQQKLVK